MALTGQVAFYKKSKALYADGATITVSTGSDTANYILGTNTYLYWESVGSDDTTTETIEIEFPSASDIDRVFLIDHNFKEFTIQYDDSGWTDFTNIVGLDGTLAGGISETSFSKDTAYYEFDSVNTTKIKITATKTQTADEEKKLTTCFATEEIGTLQGYPDVDNSFDRNAQVEKTLSGKYSIIKSYDIIDKIRLKFRVNPYQNDQDIVEYLYDTDSPFLIWLCGGKYGAAENVDCSSTPEWFKIAQKGWDLKDVYQVQTDGQLDTNFYKNIYKLDTVFDMTLREAVN